jgi:hypothetical protein
MMCGKHERPMILAKSHDGIARRTLCRSSDCARIFYAQGYGGPHFTRMLRNIFRHVMVVNEWESLLEG